ncbi:MAG: rubredoxin [Methylococcaceae bacterium]|nr:rubredoxin [Methylococcaceae bacterium]
MSDFKKYQCRECEHIYDEAKGDPDSGLAPGTRWADIPDNWSCPICGAPKDFFKLMESPL